MIVVSLRHLEPTPQGLVEPDIGAETSFASAPFLAGKMLNALLLDRTDQDLDRLQRLNSTLLAGSEAFGPTYHSVLNRSLLPYRNQGVRYVRNLLVRPSKDIGMLAAAYIRSPEFARGGRGLARSVLRRTVDETANNSSDLGSYLLFDGGFAAQLIELGRSDARALEAEWVKFFDDAPQNKAEEAQWADRVPSA